MRAILLYICQMSFDKCKAVDSLREPRSDRIWSQFWDFTGENENQRGSGKKGHMGVWSRRAALGQRQRADK